ncbi:C40 family peptidase [Curtobacterium oceanosedimentum]|uniref:C40 family peptidase n=1 Tax=Curtobacterium oceanosedimentum TaxID=465820 RepID=UPI000736B912|nr:C40 family peptidase [Curtobacterium oceanosedimentum]
MGRHALPAAPDGSTSTAHESVAPAPTRTAATPTGPAVAAPAVADTAAPRRPRGRRAALGPAVARSSFVQPTKPARTVALAAPRPVASTAVAGAAVLSRSAALRAERAADPRHVRRAANAKRAAILLAPAIAVTSSLTLAVPANAAPQTTSHGTSSSIAAYDAQSFTVARDVEVPVVQTDGMTTTTTIVSYPTIVTKYGVTTQQAEAAISKVLSAGGKRATIVSTALQYMGDPYVEGGASHSGIDCSGLTMVAYAAVGIPLVHYVPSQDAVATTIPQSEALPGDLVVFDNEDHVGIYLGDGVVLQAPHPGDPVDIVPVYPNAHHFARLLPAGE